MRKLLLQPIQLLLLGCLLAVVTAPGTAWAQLPFTRTTIPAAYAPITVAGGASASTAVGDNVIQDTLQIGFTFSYLGNNFTRFGVSSNGIMQLQTAAGMSTSAANTNLYSAGSPVNIIAPWWDDLTGTAASGAELLFQTVGAAPNRRLIVQWTNWNTYWSSTSLFSFQAVLFETTNVIEFHYGTLNPVAFSTVESASIGLKGPLGGPGNYLDAVTGSAFTGTGYMQAETKWLPYGYRFTPGAPTPIAGGTYTVGVGQTYGSLDRAAADLNHRGIAGPVVLSLTDANYDMTPANGDNIFPVVFSIVAGASTVNTVTVQPAAGTATLTYPGSASGFLANQTTTSATGTTNEPILALIGSSFHVFNNLNVTSGTALNSNNVDRGILIGNSSAIIGAQFNGFRNIAVSLNRTNTNTVAIEQRVITTPTNATGANSNCAYLDLNISNTNAGIFLNGNATFPDINSSIGTVLPTSFNLIGGATANDIGNNGAQAYGIRSLNQSGGNIFNNEVRNVTVDASTADGILVETAQGTTSIYRNRVHDIRNRGAASTTAVNGIRANSATSGTTSVRVYNNFVYNITHAYAGAATTTRIIRGIIVQAAGGGGVTNAISVDNNNIAIDGSASGNGSNTCYEIGTTSGPVITTRNNVLGNYTTGQTNGTSYHAAWASPSATAVGNTGSASNRNAFHIADPNNGHVGRGNTTNYPSLANWQTGMVGQDANSVSGNPLFLSINSNLHVTGLLLNDAASPVAYITTDIDNDARSATTPDIGADEFTPAAIDAGLYGMITPVAGACYTSTEVVVVTLTNTGTSAINFTTNACTVNVNITGAIVANLQTILNTNALNGGAPLASGASLTVPVGTFNMSAGGTYNFAGNIVLTGDGGASNNTLTPVSITYSAGTATSAKGSICAGDSSLVTLTGNTNSAAIQWQSAPTPAGPWANIAGATSSTYMAVPTDTTYYRASICGGTLFSVFDTIIYNPTIPPTAVGDTVCGRDTLVLTASSSSPVQWFAAPSGGSAIFSGYVLDTVLNVTDTFYVATISGQGSTNIGLANNSAGGGQQASTNYNIFDVLASSVTIQGVYIYPGAAGTALCQLSNSAGTAVGAPIPFTVTAAMVGQRVYMPLNLTVPQGTGWRLGQGTPSINLFRNSAGVAYPYTVPGVMSITGSAAGASFWYFFYDWVITTGCQSSRVPVIATVTPAPAITLSAMDSTICEDYSTTLMASSIDPTYSYDWAPASSLSSATGDSVIATPLTTTAYIVTGTSAASCIAQDTLTILVEAHPKPLFASSDSLICIGDSVDLGFVSAQTFWTDSTDVPVPDNSTQTSVINVSGFPGVLGVNGVQQVCFDMTHTWDADMNFTLIAPNGTTLDLSSANGGSGDNYIGTCFSMTGANGPITAGVAPFTGDFIPEGAGGFPVFAGATFNGAWTLQMQDVASGDPGLLLNWSIQFLDESGTYVWSSVPAGFSSSAASVTVTPTVTTTYSVVVADSVTGCDTTYSYTVNVNPPLSFTTNAPAGVVCPGTTVDLVATVSGGNGSYIYDWAGLSTTDSLSVVVNSDTSFVLCVLDTCSTPLFCDTIFLTVAQPLAVTAASATICEGTSATLTATATGGDGNYGYTWTGGATTNPLIVSPTTTTTYSVTVTDGCGLTPASASATVTVNPLPVAAFASGNSPTGTTFTNQSTNGVSYFWDFGDGVGTSTLQNPVYLYGTSGNYTACLTTTNACGSDTICNSLVSNEQSFGNGSVQLWPSPNNGKFNVRVSGLQGSDLTMTLFHMNGQRVLTQAFGTSFNTVEHTFSNELPAGAYFLRVEDGVNSATLRLVVQ